MIESSREIFEPRNYLFVDTLYNKDDEVAKCLTKWGRRLQVQVKSKIFKSVDHISFTSFLSAFKLDCDTNGGHARDDLWLLQFLWSAPRPLHSTPALQYKLRRINFRKKGTTTSYWETVNTLLKIYDTNDPITETDGDMVHFTQPSSQSPAEYAGDVWDRVLRCHRVYDKYLLKGIFLEGLSESIQHTCISIGDQNRTLQNIIWRTMRLC